MGGWTRAQLRHLLRMLRFGPRPAVTVYESLGDRLFLALAPGWMNLGLWEGPGDPAEAAVAPRRLVEAVSALLSPDGVILDVGNGLGVQDVVIAEVVRPRRLVALNITEFQLRAGRHALGEAGALPVCGDAVRLPVATGAIDGVISVEAPFHFSSRATFFAEARRVLRPGGVLSLSDFATPHLPRNPMEFLAGVFTMRFFGLRRAMLAGPDDIEAMLRGAGFVDVRVERCAAVVLDPALRYLRQRLCTVRGVPRLQQWGARMMIAQWELLRRRGLLDYVLACAAAPSKPSDVGGGWPRRTVP